mmetsp:Transcript_44204/g.65000  ORF Transcript_44204/g.65000 Transcript_44204/m.65000 type:complete len:128 (-) Transcript_44204:45-428(-)
MYTCSFVVFSPNVLSSEKNVWPFIRLAHGSGLPSAVVSDTELCFCKIRHTLGESSGFSGLIRIATLTLSSLSLGSQEPRSTLETVGTGVASIFIIGLENYCFMFVCSCVEEEVYSVEEIQSGLTEAN